jgi:hypothetical protein
MSRSVQDILEDARKLPPAEVDWLVESLLIEHQAAKPEVAAAWDAEIKHRLDEIDSGTVELIPGEQARTEIVAGLSSEARAQRRA